METKRAPKNEPLAPEGHPSAWKFAMLFLVVLTPGFAALNPALHHEFWPLLLAFVVVPIIDYLVGVDVTNPASEKEEKRMSSLWRYQALLLLWVPFSLLIMMAVLPMCSTLSRRYSLYMTCFAVIAVGLANGLGINVAHELIHKNGFERICGRLLLVCVCYGHFEIEHLHGHHKRVATPDDPATASRGQTFYSFWVQSVFGGWRSAWRFEIDRCRPMRLSLFHNRCFRTTCYSLVISMYIYMRLGPSSLLAFFGQAFVAISILEVVNYTEHSGLLRRQTPAEDGTLKYEPVSDSHSWDSAARITNYLLFQLQRHADHHKNPLRRYQILHHTKDAPQVCSNQRQKEE